MLRTAVLVLALACLCLAQMRIKKLVDRANGTVYENGHLAQLMGRLGIGRYSLVSWAPLYYFGGIPGSKFAVSAKLEMGTPSDGCSLTNFKSGDFDPENTLLMLEFWKDDYRRPDHTGECDLPEASLELKEMGWKYLMFSCPGHDCSVVYNTEYSLVSYASRLEGMTIFFFYERMYNVTKRIYQDYEIYVFANAEGGSGMSSIDPVYLAQYILSVGGCLIVLGYLIFKFVVYMHSTKKTVHMTITFICNIVALCCLITYLILMWCWLYLKPSAYYLIFGMLATGFSFLGSANFSLAMWWSGFLFPKHQRGFHSRVLLGVVLPFFLGFGIAKIIVERTNRENVMSTIVTIPGLVLLFAVSIHMVVIGIIMTRTFFYSQTNQSNLHIKSLKRSDAKKIIALLTTCGVVVFALLYMSVVFRLTVDTAKNIENWQIQYSIPAFFGAVNIFLVTFLHNIRNPKGHTTINSSSLMGHSSGSDLQATSSTTR